MSDNKKKNYNKMSYETATNELEDILNQLESSDLPLEEALQKFESGVKLVKHCQSILDTTEQKIKTLTEQEMTTPSSPQKSNSDSDIPF